MVNLANTVTTSPVKQTQSTGKLININESALLQQARIYRFGLMWSAAVIATDKNLYSAN